MTMMHRNQTANVHQFAMVPKAEIPRSSFKRQFTHKTTFDENYLVPIYVDEVLPGDTFSLRMTAFARLATPIFPLMDNLYLDTFFFFVPNRLVWTHWINFMGEQNNPADSIAFTIPTITSPANGYGNNTIYDYFGLPCAGQTGVGNTITHSALPLRSYNLIWDQWFRDENLQNSTFLGTTLNGDGPDVYTSYALQKRGKRHDYFTSGLPWTQKGGTTITIPLGTQAPIKGLGTSTAPTTWATGVQVRETGGGTPTYAFAEAFGSVDAKYIQMTTNVAGTSFPNVYADLTNATAATINQLRQSFQIQKLLERDARGGTRYTEIVRSHFGVISPDARLQRPEYLGGNTTPVHIAPIPQTSGTGLTGGSSPLGTLSAYATILANAGFTQSFTEHGHIIGLANIRADVTYQQGIRKMWKRSTRYDFYFPAFAMLGEQSIINYEIYSDGSANDALAFAYQERWAEYRYLPNMITGQFRSTYATPLDAWHLAEKFTSVPTITASFITQNTPISRVVAVSTPGAHFIFDSFFDCKTTRPMPLYSVPGLIDHF